MVTQSNKSINTDAFSPTCLERNFLPPAVARSGLSRLMHVEGSARDRLDVISEMTRSISCTFMVVI